MTIERCISIVVILVVGLFLANASVPEAALGKGTPSIAPTCVPCPVPVSSWGVPATAGTPTGVRYINDKGQVQTVCPVPASSWGVPATAGTPTCVQYTNDKGQVQTVCPVVTPAYALGDTLGSILEFPFVVVQSLIGSCP